MNSNDKLARLAGLLYLMSLPTTGLGYGIGRSLLGGDAVATLTNIQANRGLFEVAIVAGAVGAVSHLVLVLVLYRLFSVIDKRAATLVVAFMAASVPLSLVAVARQIDVLSLLDGAQGIPAIGGDQLQVQVMLALHGYSNVFLTSTIFWGLWLIPLGWLVFRSGFMPRVLGILLMYGSLFYLISFVGTVFDTSYADLSFARIAGILTGIPSVSTEMATALWLLIMGARERRTMSRSAAPAS